MDNHLLKKIYVNLFLDIVLRGFTGLQNASFGVGEY